MTSRLFSGGQPEGEESFRALEKLGVKTILSVDGATPDVSTASKYGLRYVHIPVGYDGIKTNEAVRIAQAATVLPGPIFVHCHHGKHRGPAAVAIACASIEGWNESTRLAWLKQAGTGAEYVGLFKTVDQFRPPTAKLLSELPIKFTDKAEVPALVNAMVRIDGFWDTLRMNTSKENALFLLEEYRELLRQPLAARQNGEIRPELVSAESRAEALLHLLSSADPGGPDPAELEKSIRSIGQSCTACHQKHRQ
ncbi:MAG TPA: hypothetical protein VK968_16530 [Roseimicrobium sp.]|nr:hypothetical protein [Roseimicrobium sp.]